MSEKREFRVGEDEAGRRLDIFLARSLSDYSRTRLKRFIEEGRVLVNGERVKPRHALSSGDRVGITIPPPSNFSPAPEPIPLNVIFEDDSIIVINKSPGLLVHPVRAGQGGTLVNALLHHCRGLSRGSGILRPGIVHRLDRNTSGVMVAAKNDRAHAELVRQFKDRSVDKEYFAIVRGNPSRNQGQLTYPIGRANRKKIKMVVRYTDGRKAHTEYEVLERFEACSLIRLVIKTGRTHQIRVHLSRLGCRVLGDKTYGPKINRKQNAPRPSRQMLHSHRLRIAHPETCEPMEFIAPIPGDMNEVLAILRDEKTDKQ